MSINRRFYRLSLLYGVIALSARVLLADSSKTPTQTKPRKSLQDLIAGSSPQATPIAGVRGLEEEKAEVDTSVRDYAAVGRLEAFHAHPGELEKFIKEGRLK